MFSGKSEELIRRVRRAQIARQKVQLFKPRIDARYSAGGDREPLGDEDAVAGGGARRRDPGPGRGRHRGGGRSTRASSSTSSLVEVVDALANRGPAGDRRRARPGLPGAPVRADAPADGGGGVRGQDARGLHALRRAGQPLAAPGARPRTAWSWAGPASTRPAAAAASTRTATSPGSAAWSSIPIDGAAGRGRRPGPAHGARPVRGHRPGLRDRPHPRPPHCGPGLRPQHLAAVRAAGHGCGAEVHGAFDGSPDLRFLPGAVDGGRVPASTSAPPARPPSSSRRSSRSWPRRPEPSRVDGRPEGPTSRAARATTSWPGTGAEVVGRLGPAAARCALERAGFYPRGEGRVRGRGGRRGRARRRLDLTRRGALVAVRGISGAARLRGDVARRAADAARALLWEQRRLETEWDVRGAARGVARRLPAGRGGVRERARGVRAARGAGAAAPRCWGSGRRGALLRFLDDEEAVVDPWLADQLAVPLALAGGGGRLTTSEVTLHLETVAAVLRRFGFDAETWGRRGGPGRPRGGPRLTPPRGAHRMDPRVSEPKLGPRAALRAAALGLRAGAASPTTWRSGRGAPRCSWCPAASGAIRFWRGDASRPGSTAAAEEGAAGARLPARASRSTAPGSCRPAASPSVTSASTGPSRAADELDTAGVPRGRWRSSGARRVAARELHRLRALPARRPRRRSCAAVARWHFPLLVTNGWLVDASRARARSGRPGWRSPPSPWKTPTPSATTRRAGSPGAHARAVAALEALGRERTRRLPAGERADAAAWTRTSGPLRAGPGAGRGARGHASTVEAGFPLPVLERRRGRRSARRPAADRSAGTGTCARAGRGPRAAWGRRWAGGVAGLRRRAGPSSTSTTAAGVSKCLELRGAARPGRRALPGDGRRRACCRGCGTATRRNECRACWYASRAEVEALYTVRGFLGGLATLVRA